MLLRCLSKFLWYVHRKKNWYDGKKKRKKKPHVKRKKKIGQRWAQLIIFDLINHHMNITNVDQRWFAIAVQLCFYISRTVGTQLVSQHQPLLVSKSLDLTRSQKYIKHWSVNKIMLIYLQNFPERVCINDAYVCVCTCRYTHTSTSTNYFNMGKQNVIAALLYTLRKFTFVFRITSK